MNWIKSIFRIDTEITYLGSLAGAAVSFAIGGWDPALEMLFLLVVIDYVTGVIASVKTKGLDSKRGFQGGIRKVIIFIVVAFSNLLDGAMQTSPLLRSMVIFGYAANEGLSIIENIDRMGYGTHIPLFIRRKLERLKEENMGKETNG